MASRKAKAQEYDRNRVLKARLMQDPCVFLLVNLLQDVNILRPLAFISSRDLGLRTKFLVTRPFIGRDKRHVWQREIDEICQATGASSIVVETVAHALQILQGNTGVIFAASESNLSAHKFVHDVLRLTPSSIVSVTLQHGYECVGFLQSREHNIAHGQNVAFGADIICGWCAPERLTAVADSQRNKLVVTGPSTLLQQPMRQRRGTRGLVCENLHSVRLSASGDVKVDFISVFEQFCRQLGAEGGEVVLRPHPGGQYTLKNNVPIPSNVVLNNQPIYKTNLTRYLYGISAPSSILIDMVLAGIPVAVWRDGEKVMDADNYNGLATVSSLSDWLEFAREATAHPERYIERQEQFLADQKLVTDRASIYQRFAEIMWAAARLAAPQIRRPLKQPTERILFVANSFLPTLQLSFVKPLASLVEAGEIETGFLLEQDMKDAFGDKRTSDEVRPWIEKRLEDFSPSILVFCRYSGPHSTHMTEWARENGVPVIFHIDDDLLNVPEDLGKAKHAYHNGPKRLQTVRHLLDNADLVYCSNKNLEHRLRELGAKAPMKTGSIYASGKVLVPARKGATCKVGYMASADHAHNLEMIKPAIVQLLRRNSDVEFELFGSIPKLSEFDEFGDRVRKIPPLKNYENFMRSFAELGWDIGICPLVGTPFNRVKSNTKWVEYTSVGAAVVASRDTVYDECCSDGCGILASTSEEWLQALEYLVQNPEARFEQTLRAQKRVAADYGLERLREQVLSMFAEARRSLDLPRNRTRPA